MARRRRRELTRAGAQVGLRDLNIEAALRRLASELQWARAAIEMDVTLAASIGAVAGEDPDAGHILVNNAGIGLVGDIAATSEEDFERVMRVNAHSVYLVTKAMLPLLLDEHGDRL